MTTWFAEDVPWYSVDQSVPRPMDDEGSAMSAPNVLGEFTSRVDAAEAVAGHLARIAAMSHVWMNGDSGKYQSAADAMQHGADGVRISGRFYRVREA